jgi:hypothetical protein
MRRATLLLLLPLLAASPARPAAARQGGMGPGAPIFPRPGQLDYHLYDKAVRIQRRMWRHLSPEGVLVHAHRRGADGPALSHDATLHPDVAIWTGCYAAAQACRWQVTRDPDALEQCRALARGLALLSEATGTPGALARNVGRPIPGEPVGERLEASPSHPGLWFRGDPSRDQLSGFTLGWALLYAYVDDPEVRALAKRVLPAVARRLHDDDMWLRDPRGHRTEYGETRKDIEFLPFSRNGALAAIGLAPILVAAAIAPESGLSDVEGRMKRAGWHDALSAQNTFLPDLVNASNVNMVNLSLLAITVYDDGYAEQRARWGLDELRAATVGWWNAGFCACQLLAGVFKDRPRVVAELRRTLHDMTEDDDPPGQESLHDLGRITTVAERGVQGWTWADSVRRRRTYVPWAPGAVPVQYTRADYLFAYWLARAAGELRPRVGPGADPLASRIAPDRPPWWPAPAAR